MTYDVQFLLGTRKSKNQTTVVSEGMSAAVTPINGKNTELSGFSNTVLSSETDPDFWKELQDNLHMMLKESGIPEYSIHKYGGLLTVRATQKEHRQLRSYVQNLKKKVMSQVLIEAKIVEVELKREYSQGIEWGVLLHTAQAKLGFNQDFIASSAAAPRFVFNAMQEDGRGLNIQSFLKLLQNFGRLHTISNPRITVLNNQTAILKIATNEVFFSQIKDRIYNKNLSSPMEEMSTKIHTIPVGLLLMVHPSIDTDGSIVLSFRPTIANVTSYVTNPGFEGQKSQVPVIRLRVMDSVMRLQSGEVMAAGGLIEEEYRGRNERGLQALNHEKKSVKRELVIFVKVQQLENYPLHSFPPEWLNPED
jgi:general secretion pathway protein D